MVTPSRTIHHTDGVAWLRDAALPGDAAIVTSLPDHSELPALGFPGWRDWFVETAALACRRASDDGVVVFYQTDVKWDGCWVDKGYLVSRGAELAGSALLWHKIACRKPPGHVSFGRPGYAHVLCFSRRLRLTPGQSSADVLPSLGEMPWARAMGVDVCEAVVRFLVKHTPCRTVVDPFCGHGTVLAVANRLGLDAVGVELSGKRAAKASALRA
jgi:hypothetical protein